MTRIPCGASSTDNDFVNAKTNRFDPIKTQQGISAGINYAIGDAVEAANVLAEPILVAKCTDVAVVPLEKQRFK